MRISPSSSRSVSSVAGADSTTICCARILTCCFAACGEIVQVVPAARRMLRGDQAIRAAREALAVEESKLEELNSPNDVNAETVARDQAQGSLDRANETLAEVESRSGPQVPLGEVVFVSALPATVNTLSAKGM